MKTSIMDLDSAVSTKVTFKIEKYDDEQAKNVVVNKSFDKLNRALQDTMVLDELGQLIVDAIDGRSVIDIVVTKQDSINKTQY